MRNNDIKNIITNCPICSMKDAKLLKNEPSKQIIAKFLKQRYVGDLTNLPYQFRLNNEYKYIFTIINHFSRMADSFLLIEKTGQNIINSLNKSI